MKFTVNKEAVTFRVLDGEAIIINKKNSYFYTLNKIATFIWGSLTDHELALEDIVNQTARHYQKNEKEINEDINKLIANLTKNNLLKKINSTAKTPPSSDQKSPASNKQTEKYEPPTVTKYEKLEKLIIAAV